MKLYFFLLMVVLVLLSGCTQNNKELGENDVDEIIENKEVEQRPNLGSLCLGEESCKEFCLNNMGRCTEYCNSNPENPLCKTLFNIVDNSEQLTESSSKSQNIGSSDNPILKNLGVNIEPWDRKTNKAGDLIFTKSILYDDSYISNDKVFIDFGHKEKYRPNDIGSIEYWFFVPLGTKLQAPVDGFIQVAFFNHTQDWGVNIRSESSDWIVSFEHVVNVEVTEGDTVKAGDVVAEAAPRSTFNNQIAMTELAVWKSGKEVRKYCPFDFLDESLKPIYEQKLKKLASDWEEFIGQDVYKEEDWVSPGCLLESIKES